MIKKLCVLSAFYPSAADPYYAFVGALVEAFADSGIECHVITPVPWFEKAHPAQTREERTVNGAVVKVYCPRCCVYPYRKIGGLNTFKLTARSRYNAIRRAYKRYVGDCDAIYSHFIANAGIYAAMLGKEFRKPTFMALGESALEKSAFAYDPYRSLLRNGFNGIVAVSSPLKEETRRLGLVSEDTPIEVFPNATDLDVFRPRDRAEARRALGLKDEFVVGFVGGFIKRKGFGTLQRVIARHPDWKAILIGKGTEEPLILPPSQQAFVGRVEHTEIPRYLSAADVFALPTHAEGCCNAIVEALACGLPVVSSDRSFNDDLLTDDCSLRVDPTDESALERALVELSESGNKRASFAEAAFARAQNFSIENRAKNIVNFMERNS